MAGRSSAALAAILGLGVGAGLFFASSKATPGRGPSGADLTAIAGEIDALLRESAASVRSRAQTIADLPSLASSVATDAATVRDQTQEELAFRVKPGETIEIGQVFSNGSPPAVLLRIPADMKYSPPLGEPGQHLMVDGSKLIVTEVVKVMPRERAEELSGAIAVSQEIGLGGLVDRLDKLGTAARIELDGKPVIVGSRVPQAGSATSEASPQSPLGKRVKVVAEVSPATTTRSGGLLGAGALAALAGLAGAVVLSRRGAAGAASAASASAGNLAAPAGGVPSSVVHSAAGTGVSGAAAGLASTELAAEAPSGIRGRPLPRMSSELASGAAPLGSFGRYTLLKLLGSGGMAEVYLARSSGEAGFEKQVALKIMHANLSTQEKVVDLFLDEARIVSRLTHPNIVQISDLGRDGTDYFIAMELVDGWDLDKLVRAVRARSERVPLRVGLTILRKICDGLHAAHTAVDAEGKPLELVHRDVKSENVLLSRGGAVKVCDFGIAKANQQVHKTQLGELKGTAAYMAPEHRTGQAVDRRADVYGVGAIAYELLTGAEVNLDLAMLAHLGREGWPHLAAPTKVRSDLPPELDAIIFKALSYEREARYDTCEAFEEALDGVGTRYGLTASDKVVAQWVDAVIAASPAAVVVTAGTPAQGGAA